MFTDALDEGRGHVDADRADLLGIATRERQNGRTATKDYSVIRRTKVLRPYCCKATATSTAGPTMRQLVREMDLRPDWRISRAFQGARETSRTLPPCRTTDYTGEPRCAAKVGKLESVGQYQKLLTTSRPSGASLNGNWPK
jgi:hypothetical protein